MTSVALEGLKNNINNYKGVMLCARPNENIGAVKDRPFVSRVDPKDQVGINPVRRIKSYAPAKRVNPVLARHRAWLNQFTDKMREKKIQEEVREIQDKERFERIRENASNQRGTADNSIAGINLDNSLARQSPQADPQEQSPVQQQVKEERVSAKPVTKKKEHKKAKPQWAYTEKQLQDEEEENVDDLLAFTNNLDYDKYIDDLEVKHMITALKKRIDDIKNKEEDDWKNKIVDAWNNDKQALKPSKVDIGADDRSDVRSCASEAKSAASERSQQSISELKAKMEKHKKDWDNMSTTTAKKNAVSLEERIAKHVADEILRNNTEFRHFHSNSSVRKILEKEAQKHIEETRGIRAPEIVSNKEYFLRKDVQDPNNLPYLHRNPAI